MFYSLKKFLFSISLVTLVFVISSCGEDDLKNLSSISAKKVTLTKDRTTGAEVVYSDSAVVKARGYAPIYDKVVPAQGDRYNEMPKGVKIDFFDAYMQVTGTITSDYAINKESQKITIFKKNVVVVNDRMTFTTEELIWDENSKTYSSPSGTVVTKAGDVIRGTQFFAPQDFSSYRILDSSAEGYVKGDLN